MNATQISKMQSANRRLIVALQRLVLVDEAHKTIHAPDDDDVARMVEHAAAFDNARTVLAEVNP